MHNDRIDYGKIIKTLRKKYRLTQSELGSKISVGKTAISNYETGYSVPSAHILENLAEIFDMSLVEFLTYDSEQTDSNLLMPRLNQPINDMVIPYIKEANINVNTVESQKYMDSYLTLPAFMLNPEADYLCIKMPDDSMLGDNIRKNDYIIVRKNNHAENRKIVLVINKATGVHMVRRFIRDDHIVAFVPSSSSDKYSIYRADERENEYLIVGYVEKVISSIK